MDISSIMHFAVPLHRQSRQGNKCNLTLNFQDMNNKPILEELAQAGETSPVTPLVLKLDDYRIASDTQVPEEEFLLRMFGRPCFPRRDLTTITGLEKCGKTFFTSMLMACCAEKRVLELERIREEPLRVMWYDTEQSRQSTKSILTDRVFKLVKSTDSTDGISAEPSNLESGFFIFNVRACTYEERMEYLVAGIEAYKPDLVIIDNVSDLLASINDAEQSIQVIDQLMQMATTHNCNITVVIHLNRSGEKRNLRGWLGTEILHKAFEVYYCEQIPKTEVFSVEQLLTRKFRINETLYYRINEEGLPEITVKPDVQPRASDGRYMSNKPEAYQIRMEKADSFCQDYIIRHEGNSRTPWEWNLRKLFGDAMGNRTVMIPADLRQAAMQLSGIQQPKYYDKVFQLAVDYRVIQTTMDRNGRVVVIPLPS